MKVESRKDDGTIESVSVDPQDEYAEEHYEAARADGLGVGEAWAFVVATFPNTRDYLCYLVGLPLPHKLDFGDAEGQYTCAGCGWHGEYGHTPASRYGDLRITDRCYDGRHADCQRIWSCFPLREHGWCMCACHVEVFPLLNSEATERYMQDKDSKLGPLPTADEAVR